MKKVNKEDVMSKAMMAYVANDHYYYPSAGMSGKLPKLAY